jgi:hypothetical protein
VDGGGFGDGVKDSANFGEVGDHLIAFGGVREERLQGGGEVGGGEAGLEELGDDAAAGDEVDHGDGEVAVGVEVVCGPDLGRVLDEAFGETEG